MDRLGDKASTKLSIGMAAMASSSKKNVTIEEKPTADTVEKQETPQATREESPRHPNPYSRVKAMAEEHGATIFQIAATRRLARNLISKIRKDKPPAVIPPTYQLEPTKVFNAATVEHLIQRIVDIRLKTFKYSARAAVLMTRLLTSECKDAVKKLNYSRYKFVCHVTIGEKKGQSVSISSQCAWDTNIDNMITCSWENSESFCNVAIYAIYHN